MTDFWTHFAQIEKDALATADGKLFAAAGFKLRANGGNCTAWHKDLGRGQYVLITDGDGCSHDLSGEADKYLIGMQDDEGNEYDYCEAATAQEAIAIASEL